MKFRDGLRIVEGIEGYWHYHLAEEGKYQSLCDKRVMNTAIPIESWEKRGNPELREKWCDRCAAMGASRDAQIDLALQNADTIRQDLERHGCTEMQRDLADALVLLANEVRRLRAQSRYRVWVYEYDDTSDDALVVFVASSREEAVQISKDQNVCTIWNAEATIREVDTSKPDCIAHLFRSNFNDE